MDWIQYWNGTASVDVNERHRRVHYGLVGAGTAAGARNGFFVSALVGLVRTAFSDYRRVQT